MSCFRASLIAAAATAALAAPARAQDPIDLSGFIEPSAPGDTTQLIDRVVAIVGDTALLRTEVLESILQARSQGLEIPDPGTPAFDSLFSQTMYNLVDQLIILQKAEQQDLPMNDDVLERETDARFREIRNSFTSGAQFQSTVRESGRTLVQYRQMLRTQVRARMMIQSYLAENRDNLPPVAVTEEEIQEYFEEFFVGPDASGHRDHGTSRQSSRSPRPPPRTARWRWRKRRCPSWTPARNSKSSRVATRTTPPTATRVGIWAGSAGPS